MRRLLCVLAFIATPALADPPRSEAEASMGALADGLIDSAGAEGVFEALPAENIIVLRHARSGLVCRMEAGRANRLVIFPQAARGEDVACDTHDDHESITLYATRFPFETNLDEQAEGAEAAIRQRFSDAQPLAPAVEISSDTLPANRTLQFIVTRDGQRTYTRASITQVGGWIIKLRYSAFAPDDAAARQAEQSSGRLWQAALRELAAPRP